MRHLKCNVKDVNYIEVNDKNNPSKIYETNISFICWYPSDKFDKKYIDANGYSKVSNITCFMTDKNGCLMQNPFYRDCYGYIIDEFQTNGVFMSDSMSNNGVEILPGQRAQVIDKDKPSNGKKKNPYNILKHHSPIKKLVEKTMRYYSNNTNKNQLIDANQWFDAVNIGNNAAEFGLKQKNLLIFDQKNKKTLMTHNDIVLDKSVPAKISNFIIHHNCQFSFDKAKDVIDICKNTFKKDYVYFYNTENRIEKMNLEIFLKRNLINSCYCNMDEDTKQKMIENFDSEDVKNKITKKLFSIRYDGDDKENIKSNVDKIFKCNDDKEYKNALNELYKNNTQSQETNELVKNMEKTDKKLYDAIQKAINGKYTVGAMDFDFATDQTFHEHEKRIKEYIKTAKNDKKIDKIIKQIKKCKNEIQTEINKYYKEIKTYQRKEAKKIIQKVLNDENIQTRRINFSSPKNLSNFVSKETTI